MRSVSQILVIGVFDYLWRIWRMFYSSGLYFFQVFSCCILQSLLDLSKAFEDSPEKIRSRSQQISKVRIIAVDKIMK